MSATIKVAAPAVTQVLLADGWHEVRHGSFRIGSYQLVHGSGEFYEEILDSLSDTTPGFTFTDANGLTVAGPVSSILATRS